MRVYSGIFFLLLTVILPNANGVELAQNGPGQVLLFPFYTAENEWESYINITAPNTPPDKATAFRVRFPGRGKSFTVYPSKLQNWRASIRHIKNPPSTVMRVAEGDCVVHEDLTVSLPGSDFEVPGQRGMIEVYALGEFEDQGRTCETLAERWQPGGLWDIDPQRHLLPGTGALIGELIFINVKEGLAASYTATALNNLKAEFPHTPPGSTSPNLAEADPIAVVGGDELIPSSGEGIDAVALALSQNRKTVINDVILSRGINARTDWVISYPLDPYKNYKPFEIVHGISDDDFSLLVDDCEAFGARHRDRPTDKRLDMPIDINASVFLWGDGESNFVPEENAQDVQFFIAMCGSVNVVSFGDNEPILVRDRIRPLPGGLSPEPKPIPDALQNSSYSLRWSPYPAEFPEGSGIPRPVLGFRITTFQNGTLDDGRTLGNYAILRPHQRQ